MNNGSSYYEAAVWTEKVYQKFLVGFREIDLCLHLMRGISLDDAYGIRGYLHKLLGISRIIETPHLEEVILQLQKEVHEKFKLAEASLEMLDTQVDSLFSHLKNYPGQISLMCLGLSTDSPVGLIRSDAFLSIVSDSASDSLKSVLRKFKPGILVLTPGKLQENSEQMPELMERFLGTKFSFAGPRSLLEGFSPNIDINQFLVPPFDIADERYSEYLAKHVHDRITKGNVL